MSGCAASTVGPETETEHSSIETTATLEGELAVHVLDVGQADVIVVVGPTDEVMVIDTGVWWDDGEPVIEYLEELGIDRIDHLVATHAHADHIGGHEDVIEHFEENGDGVGAVYDSGIAHTSQTYERYLDAVERHNLTLYEVQAGDSIPLEGAHVQVFNPPATKDSDDFHDNSVTLQVSHGETSFLFTGDLERSAEARLVDSYGTSLESDVLWAGHHGSRTSSSADFLNVVDPEAAMISSAYDSQYGHPHNETLERFAERSIRTFWTGTHGTVVFKSDGSAIDVCTQEPATTDPLFLETADEADTEVTAPVEKLTRILTGYAGQAIVESGLQSESP